MNKYPIEEKDNLGRTIKTTWSDSKVTIKKYWDDTKKIKIIYTVFYNLNKPAEITIDAFDKEGNIIINVSNALGVRILIPGFYINKQGLGSDIKFLIESGKLKKWKNLIKNY
jgi:hypothetical protein